MGWHSAKYVFKKNCRVPRASTWQNKFLKIKKIAECHPLGTRQNLTAGGRRHGPATFCRVPWHSAKPSFAESQALPSAWHSAKLHLPSALFCRVRHSAKYCFADCPDKKHSTKSQALGKVQFSSGACHRCGDLHGTFTDRDLQHS